MQTIQADNNVVLHQFYNSGARIVLKNPNWLIPQPEPVVLDCYEDYKIQCRTTYMYHNGWHIEYLYSLANDNKIFDPNKKQGTYDQAYINKQLAAAQKAAQIATSILEEMRE